MKSPFSNPTPSKSRPSHEFVILALQGLGDALEGTPLLAGLREAWPDAAIDVAVTRASVAELFGNLGGVVRRVIYLPFWETGVFAFARTLCGASLRARYDVSLTTYPAAKLPYHLTARAFRASTRVGHAYRSASSLPFRPYTRIVPIRNAHNVERNLDLLRALGVSPQAPPAYLVPDSWRARDTDQRLVTIHVGSTSHDGFSNKRWSIDSFAQLAGRLAAEGFTITTLEGPDEVDDVARLVSQVPEIRVIHGPLGDVARHLSRSALVIANDSGIGHLAAAVGARTLTLLGPTVPDGAPFGERAVTLRPSSCPPCFDPIDRGLSCKRNIDFACLHADLPVEAALRAALAQLAELQLT